MMTYKLSNFGRKNRCPFHLAILCPLIFLIIMNGPLALHCDKLVNPTALVTVHKLSNIAQFVIPSPSMHLCSIPEYLSPGSSVKPKTKMAAILKVCNHAVNFDLLIPIPSVPATQLHVEMPQLHASSFDFFPLQHPPNKPTITDR